MSFCNANEIFEGFRRQRDELETGKMYLRLTSRRLSPEQPSELPSHDDPVFGPISGFKMYAPGSSVWIAFPYGHYIVLPSSPYSIFRDGLFVYEGAYYSPELFVA